MAVEAHHLRLFPDSQLLRTTELLMGSAENQSCLYNDIHMGFLAAPSTGAATGPAATSFLPFYVNPTTAAASESGLTCNNLLPPAASSASMSRKRPRNDSGVIRPLSFLGEEISSHVQQQIIDIDQLIIQHTEEVRMELMERRRRLARQIAAGVEAAFAKRLKAKEEEIERIGKLNWALEERIKSLCVENQIWRNLAQSNEATANVLRSKLEQVLAGQVKVKEEEQDCAAAAAADDAESCCCGDNSDYQDANVDNNKNTVGSSSVPKGGTWRSLCWICREREPTILLLPCRHLCLCAACVPVVNVCPVCSCSKKASVHVNMT